MHRNELLALLRRHRTRFPEEAGFLSHAIAYVEDNTDVFFRELWPAHVTGSAWVVNPGRNRALMMHHRKLGQWFQPGGHADGDADIIKVALKETAEETGIPAQAISLVSREIFDLDVHSTPPGVCNPSSHRSHEHIDIRFLVEIDDSLPVPGNDESHEILWVDLRQIPRFNNNRSTYRMMQKTRQLQGFGARRAAAAGELRA